MALLSTDPIDWLLANDGDIALGEGLGADAQWSRGVPGIAQGIRIAILMVRGEWFLNDQDGVPYWERPGVPASEALLGTPYNELKVLAAYREAIESAPGVNRIVALNVSQLNKGTRGISVTWTVRTTFGDTIAETTIATGGQ